MYPYISKHTAYTPKSIRITTQATHNNNKATKDKATDEMTKHLRQQFPDESRVIVDRKENVHQGNVVESCVAQTVCVRRSHCADLGGGIWDDCFGHEDRSKQALTVVRTRGRSEEKKSLTYCSVRFEREIGRESCVGKGGEHDRHRGHKGRDRSRRRRANKMCFHWMHCQLNVVTYVDSRSVA